ncbi:MAG: cytochrome c3 family protein [Candidatus Hydrothermarchaeales archaeon]
MQSTEECAACHTPHTSAENKT